MLVSRFSSLPAYRIQSINLSINQSINQPCLVVTSPPKEALRSLSVNSTTRRRRLNERHVSPLPDSKPHSNQPSTIIWATLEDKPLFVLPVSFFSLFSVSSEPVLTLIYNLVISTREAAPNHSARPRSVTTDDVVTTQHKSTSTQDASVEHSKGTRCSVCSNHGNQ